MHAEMDKTRFHNIVGLFQEDSEVVARFLNEVPPQYMVGTTKLIGMGLTLTKIRRMVQLDPEQLFRDELQACKQINRITQQFQTHFYSLLCEGLVAKSMICDWQNRRKILLSLTLGDTEIDVRDICRGIRDDTGDGNDGDEEEIGKVAI